MELDNLSLDVLNKIISENPLIIPACCFLNHKYNDICNGNMINKKQIFVSAIEYAINSDNHSYIDWITDSFISSHGCVFIGAIKSDSLEIFDNELNKFSKTNCIKKYILDEVFACILLYKY